MRIPRVSRWTGERLARLRYFVSLQRPELATQAAMADHLGITRSHLCALENGRYTPGPATEERLDQAAARFGVARSVFGNEAAPITRSRLKGANEAAANAPVRPSDEATHTTTPPEIGWP